MHADRGQRARWRASALVACALVVGNAPCLAAAPPASPDWSNADAAARRVIVAITDKPEPSIAAGATPRGYAGVPAYIGSERASLALSDLAAQNGMREISAWTISALRLRCAVLELAPGDDPAQAIAKLGRDRRVRLVQRLQAFETLGTLAPPSPATPTNIDPVASRYNDPYFALQGNLSTIDGANAQRWTDGSGVRIAVIDAGVDASHPDFGGRIAAPQDFVDPASGGGASDRHGTEVAGVIAAVANNRLGIVGVAPGARVLALRACWPVQVNAASARCNSYTLALALGAAIDAKVRVINLSLGGPADPLLAELVGHAIASGIVVVGAVPPDGRMDGFPVGIAGVVAVTAAGDASTAAGTLSAPGRDILTLQPGGGFDYVSGSSLAAAQVSGTVALLLSLQPRLPVARVRSILAHSQHVAGAPIDACRAVEELRAANAHCALPATASAARQP